MTEQQRMEIETLRTKASTLIARYIEPTLPAPERAQIEQQLADLYAKHLRLVA
jgi:hypothetical protein